MAGPLVATKLFIPKLRAGLVERLRLRERLKRGAHAKLTLISAPAGFGKTTLLAEWLAAPSAGNSSTAWLSLDKDDNDPTVFWSYLVTALQNASPGIGADLLAGLRSGHQTTERDLAGLVNELGSLPFELHLVLDDYHVVEHAEIQAGLAFLLHHIPPNVHFTISTRVDPQLPLARLRGRGELVEVRSADLRFTGEEASAYFNEEMQLGLSMKDITSLGERTEGWIAALQLAALSMQGRDDLSAFVAGFAGNDRYIFDYLVEEVLQRQSDDVRRFLLRTCFLDRLSGSLCDAVTGSGGGREMLEALDRDNLFLVPLDDHRQWYRYHHLFADVLQSQVGDDSRQELPVLHQRASDWYEQYGYRPLAIQHALAAEDLERAAELMELAIPDLAKNRGEAMVRSWAHTLPVAFVRTRPVLGIALVGGLVSFGEFDEIEERLGDVERCLTTLAQGSAQSANAPGDQVVIVDPTQLPRLPGAVELYRAALAQVRGDISALVTHAGRVLELAPVDDHAGRAAGSSMLGIAYWSQGQLEAAYNAWTEGRNGLLHAGHIADTLGVTIALSDILLTQGHLEQAIQNYEQALHVARIPGQEVLRGTADMHAGLSNLYRERNDLRAARQQLATSQDLGERAGLPQHPYRWRVAMAHLQQDEGDFAGATELLDEAERLYVSDFFPDVRPVSAMRARVWITQGRLDDASRWHQETGLTATDDLSYLREYCHITLTRLLLARDTQDRAAVRLLDRLLQEATKGGRMRSVIEISLLQALTQSNSTTGMAAALVPLVRALTVAEPEGYVRIFLDGGEGMVALLREALKRGITPAYTRELLAAFGPNEPKMPSHPDLIEPLSDRELDVLRLLRSELGGPEIARELMISLNTVRTHTRNIYEKLGVTNRRSAVGRALELDLPLHKTR